MLNEKIYKLVLENNNLVIGEILGFESLKYGEKENDFVDAEISFYGENLNQRIRENLVVNSILKIYRKSSGSFKVVWAGRMLETPDYSLDSLNLVQRQAKFIHLGKDFLEKVFINKNYNFLGGVDEGLIAQDMVLYSQTGASYGGGITDLQANYGITIGTIELTGNLRNIDFSSKPVNLQAGLKQILDFDDNTGNKKLFKISPNLIDSSIGKFRFFSNFNNLSNVSLSAVRSLTSSSFYQSIKSLKISNSEIFNRIIANGDGISYTATSTNQSLLNTLKVRTKYVSFKNVSEISNLESLAKNELKKFENPNPVIDIEITENDNNIGNFSVIYLFHKL